MRELLPDLLEASNHHIGSGRQQLVRFRLQTSVSTCSRPVNPMRCSRHWSLRNNGLRLGDLNSSQAAFQTLQNLNQNLENASGSSRRTTPFRPTWRRSAVRSAPDLSTAQSAFAAAESDLKSSNLPSQTNEINAASQSVQMVQQVLSTLNGNSSSSSADNTTSVLERVYGSTGGGLNVLA